MATALKLDEKSFESTINEGVTLVDFWAEWCGPCVMMSPVIDELAGDYDGKAKIAKVNVDENPGVSMKFGIRSIPTLLVFKNGEVVDKVVGAVQKSALKAKLDPHV
jgi:thioredoxin 1